MSSFSAFIEGSLAEDEDKGCIWLSENIFKETQCDRREVAKVTNVTNGKSIYCEIHKAEELYERKWLLRMDKLEGLRERHPELDSGDNKFADTVKDFKKKIDEHPRRAYISNQYRERLGIDRQVTEKLSLARSRWWGQRYLYIYMQGSQHPEMVIRFATFIGLVSVISLFVTLVSSPLSSKVIDSISAKATSEHLSTFSACLAAYFIVKSISKKG